MRESSDFPFNFSVPAECGLLEEVLEEMDTGVAIISVDYRTIWASKALRSRHGDLEGDFCFHGFCKQRETCSDCVVQGVFEKGQERVTRERSSIDVHGNPVRSQTIARPLRDDLGNVVAAVVVVLPITEPKEAEQSSHERQARLDSIIRVAPIGIGVVIDRVPVEVNDQLCTMTGYSAEELLNHPSRMLYSTQEEYDRVGEEKYRQIAKQGTGSVETRWIRKDGELIHILLQSTPLDREDCSKGVIFTALDTTVWKQTEEALRRSEEKYRQVVEHAIEAIFIAQDARIKFPNSQMVRGLGYSKEELSKGSFIRFIHPEDRGMVLERYRKRLLGEGSPTPYAFRALNRAGETLWVELTGVTIQWEGRPASLTFARDITEHKKLEAQLIQSQKMEAIGTLAGGVAHDFNNLLTGILGFTSLLLRTMPPDDPSYAKIQRIEQLGKSGADLTKQLLGFARGGRYDVRSTNLNELVLKTVELFGRTRKEVAIYPTLQEDLPGIEVDGSQIEQVIINLLVNAFQAMPNGGHLYLETRQETLSPELCQRRKIQPGIFVSLSVTDTGEGMDEETQRRVFEPFFSTKGMGRGTGLGLASAYGIIKNHGGIIDVSSEKGKGTTFTILLPATHGPAQRMERDSSVILTGNETILLVDDEEVILNVGREILSLLGYQVETARSGSEAVEIYQKRQEEIDLVILDVAMPGMTGGETFDRLKELDPMARVLLSSGYSINGQAEDILQRGGLGFLPKPYSVQEISVKIRSALRRPH
ncbi:MAG: PAS domain S-box protein [Syntrophobacteraceae bacterium]